MKQFSRKHWLFWPFRALQGIIAVFFLWSFWNATSQAYGMRERLGVACMIAPFALYAISIGSLAYRIGLRGWDHSRNVQLGVYLCLLFGLMVTLVAMKNYSFLGSASALTLLGTIWIPAMSALVAYGAGKREDRTPVLQS